MYRQPDYLNFFALPVWQPPVLKPCFLGNSLESLGELAVLVLRQTRVLEARRAARFSVGTARAVANENVGEVHAVSRDIVKLDGCVSG